MTSKLSGASILKSTQIGQLVQYLLLAFYYMALGRFAIDIFHTKDRNKAYDVFIYLSIFLVFTALYAILICWSLLKCKKSTSKKLTRAKTLENMDVIRGNTVITLHQNNGVQFGSTTSPEASSDAITSSSLKPEPIPDSFISIIGIKKSYGSNEVLKDFTLGINAGEVMCLLGSNGSGKTTLVNVLTGLEKLDEDT